MFANDHFCRFLPVRVFVMLPPLRDTVLVRVPPLMPVKLLVSE
jgi:hypothetical protein